jgi:hypothetical protein
VIDIYHKKSNAEIFISGHRQKELLFFFCSSSIFYLLPFVDNDIQYVFFFFLLPFSENLQKKEKVEQPHGIVEVSVRAYDIITDAQKGYKVRCCLCNPGNLVSTSVALALYLFRDEITCQELDLYAWAEQLLQATRLQYIANLKNDYYYTVLFKYGICVSIVERVHT